MDKLTRSIKQLLLHNSGTTDLDSLTDKILALIEPRWTKVEDGLPEIHGRAYWVHNRFGEHEAWYINNEFFLRNNMSPITDVTHWMPLPTLLKGEATIG